MLTLLGFFAVLARLFRPTRGAHTSPFGYLWELGAEARRNRSRRVRRYVEELAPSEHFEAAPPAPTPSTPEPRPPATPTPSIPAPRPPVEDTLNRDYPQVAIVRGPYRAWEARRSALVGVA
ncbi:MAG: hypothetical protein JK586_02730 [Nocardiopsis sp. BM-2018]|nr:MAG: hypothetical protein JK586_02730 [Nocardiopsis sp. BM-2018]